jgi:hypothetical protein
VSEREISRGLERSTEIVAGCVLWLLLPVPLVVVGVCLQLLLEGRLLAGSLASPFAAFLVWFCAVVGWRLLTAQRNAHGRLMPAWLLYVGALLGSAQAARRGFLFGPEHAAREYEVIGESLRESLERGEPEVDLDAETRSTRMRRRPASRSNNVTSVAVSAPTRITPRSWPLRPVLWFATAYTLVIILHETAHAVAALALGIHSTLFNFWVDYDPSQATTIDRAAIGIAGPTVCLVIGVICWSAYRRTRVAMPWLYLAAFGVTNFFGNLLSAAFLGDFSNAAVLLGLSPAMRYVASVVGAVSVAAMLFVTGRHLAQAGPRGVSRLETVWGLIVLPALAGTALIIAINQPTPMGPNFASARAAESAFWLFGVLGAFTVPQRPTAVDGKWRVGLADGAVAIAALVAVRIMATGILLRR